MLAYITNSGKAITIHCQTDQVAGYLCRSRIQEAFYSGGGECSGVSKVTQLHFIPSPRLNHYFCMQLAGMAAIAYGLVVPLPSLDLYIGVHNYIPSATSKE